MSGSAIIGALRVVLGIDTAIFDKGLADAMKGLKGVGKSMQSVGKTMSGYLTAPIAGLGALTLKTAGDFEASMNRVGAATGSTGAELMALETLARELGASTTKSASESADMLEMLAKNGLSAEQILDGAAEAAIKLSEATGGDLSRSADVATNVMAQFGLEAKDMAQVVDQITGVTLASQFGFDDYALALGQAGGVAGALGVSLTDFNAVMASTSDVFNSGSDAGTSFKTFLTRLVPQSSKAAEAMERLGLKFFDADGNMKSMAEVAQELQRGLSGLSDEARTAALQTIFGQDAMRTAVAMASQGAAGIQAATEEINKTGIAQEQAEARMKGFNGELENLSGAFEELQIAIAKSGLLEAITALVSGVAEWVEWLAQANPEMLKWGTIIAGVVAAIGPLLAGVGLMVTGFAGLVPVLTALAAGMAALLSPIGLAVAALAAIAGAWIYWDEIKAAFPGFAAVVETAIAAIEVVLDGLVEQFRLIGQMVVQVFSGDIAGALSTFGQMFANVGQTIVSFAETVFPGAVDAIRSAFPVAVAAAEQFSAAFSGLFAGIIESVRLFGQMLVQVFTGDMAGAFESFRTAFATIGQALLDFANTLLPGLIEAIRVKAGEIVEVFRAIPAQMIQIGAQIMQGLWDGLTSKMTEVKNGITNFAGGIVDSVKSRLGIHSPSRVMHDVGVNIMQGLQNGMQSMSGTATDGATSVADGIAGAFDGLGSSIAEAIKGTKSWRDVALEAISSVARSLLSSMNFGDGMFGSVFKGLLGGLVGFKNGGSFSVGGTGGTDSQMVAFRATPGEMVDVRKGGQARHGNVQEIIVRGVFVDDGGVVTGIADGAAKQESTKAVSSYAGGQRRGGAASDDHYYKRLKRPA